MICTYNAQHYLLIGLSYVQLTLIFHMSVWAIAYIIIQCKNWLFYHNSLSKSFNALYNFHYH